MVKIKNIKVICCSCCDQEIKDDYNVYFEDRETDFHVCAACHPLFVNFLWRNSKFCGGKKEIIAAFLERANTNGDYVD